MKKILSLLLCVMLLGTMLVPVSATEATQPTTGEEAPLPANGANVMAIICLVLIVLGVLYLVFGLKKSRQV